MNKPRNHLPTCTIQNVEKLLSHLGLAHSVIEQLGSGTHELGDYHVLWAVTYLETRDVEPKTETKHAILRVAGNHIVRRKTENEVGILSWLKANTKVPCPGILAYDATSNNALNSEYILMQRCTGVQGAKVYDQLLEDDVRMDFVLEQIVDIALELWMHPFNHIGGLRLETKDGKDTIVPATWIDENQWQVEEIAKYWPSSASFTTVNAVNDDGFPSYTSWLTASMEHYIHAIEVHESLHSWLKEADISILKNYITNINQEPLQSRLNSVAIRLIHGDWHFGNMLVDESTDRITCLLDWEFAQIVPLPLWRRGFLWSGGYYGDDRTQEGKVREGLYGRWEAKVRQRGQIGHDMLSAAQFTQEQEKAWNVCNLMRCIVEVCPRGVQIDDSKRWWKLVLQALGSLDMYNIS